MNKITKTIVGFVGIAMALSLVAVSPASAAVDFSTMSTADLQALFAQLQSRLGGVQAPAMTAPTFTRSLTLGSSGADVTALQNWLIGKGYSIPAGATGYFGAQTKAAVAAYQLAKGIAPAAGYFGPVTQARVAADSAMVVVPPTGTPNTPSTVADGQDGSVTMTRSPYVTTSQTLKKGDTKDVYAVKFQATSGKVTVNRFDVHLNTRPWLVFSKVTLKDSNGNVLATKNLSSASDVTEITTGTDYLVRFDGVNVVVSPDADTTLVVGLSVLSATDKITDGQTVTIRIPDGSVRTVNGRGYTDSLGISDTNTLTLSTSGSTGTLYARIDPTTPDTRSETISTTATTENKTLGVYSIKAQNRGGEINSLSVNIANSKGYNAPTLFQNVRLVDGSTVYGASSLSTGGVAAFEDLSINLTEDSWKKLTVVADVLATSTTGFSASSTLDVSTIVGTDSNYTTMVVPTSDITANDVTFIPNGGIVVSGITSSRGNLTAPTSGAWLAAYPSLGFTVTNNGNNPIYLSKTSSTALATTTSAGPNASSTVTSVTVSGSTTGDTADAYIVNVGASRTFTYSYTVDNTNGTTAAKKLSITQINYGTSSGSPASLNVNYGLETLNVQVP